MGKNRNSLKKSLARSITRTIVPVHKDIEIQFQQFVQVIESVNIVDCISSNQLSVKKLLHKLQKQCNFFFKDCLVRYYLEEGKIWLKCPSRNFFIESDDFMKHSSLKFQIVRELSLLNVVMNQQEMSDDDQELEEEADQEGKCRRLKERKIKHVIDKVLKWRELYAGIIDGQETDEKIPLEQGAVEVNISKKTLDDYLAQLKKGRKFGFNFNEHKNEKIGVLRQFIRKAERKGHKN